MAKVKEDKVFSLLDLNKQMIKINNESVILSKEADDIKITDFISTGNLALNAQISGSIFKGIPNGKVTMFAGESGSGKTFLCLNIVKEALKKGYKVIWIDTENAIDEDTFSRFNINFKDVMYIPIETINKVSYYLVNLADTLQSKKDEGYSIDKYLIIIDSLGNLSTDKEINDVQSNSGKADMTRAKEFKKLFRVCTKKIGRLKIPIVVTNHTYADIGSFIKSDIIAGGTGAFYNASTTLILSKAQYKEKETKTGIIVTSKIFKSRFTKGGIAIKFLISFYKGMNKYFALEKYIDYEQCGVGFGKIEKNTYTPIDVDFSKVKVTLPKYVAVKHLNSHIGTKDLFTDKVFTEDVLLKLDEKIKPIFELPNIDSNYDVDEMLGLDNEVEDDE